MGRGFESVLLSTGRCSGIILRATVMGVTVSESRGCWSCSGSGAFVVPQINAQIQSQLTSELGMHLY